jgi:hypothetical protein
MAEVTAGNKVVTSNSEALRAHDDNKAPAEEISAVVTGGAPCQPSGLDVGS